MDLMKSYIKNGNNIIDVGANIGFYSVMFSDLVGAEGKVYSFEPDNYNFSRLEDTIKGHSNITAKKAAVSSVGGQLEFYTSPDKNVDHRAYAPDEYATKYTVDCVSLDEFPGMDTKVDILKVDVQGYEMQVYKGAENIIKANPGIKIFSEFWPYGLQKAGSSKEEFFNFFDEQGFALYLLKDNKQTLITPDSLKNFPVVDAEYFNVLIYRK
jgi:FkbM family methyltransferase